MPRKTRSKSKGKGKSTPKIKAPVINETIWINENQAAQIDYNLLDGISEEIEHYIKAVEAALPELVVEDGVLRLEDIWLETSLPHDLLIQIVKECPIQWPENVERIQLNKKEFVKRPEAKEKAQEVLD